MMADSLLDIVRLVEGILHRPFKVRVVLGEVISLSRKPAHARVLALDENDRVAVPNQDVLFELALLDVVVLMDLGVWKDRPQPSGYKRLCEFVAFLEVASPERVCGKNLAFQGLPNEPI